jgi:DNA-binding NarL/FixJ family response regulator
MEHPSYTVTVQPRKSEMSDRVRVLIVDDHPAIRVALANTINGQLGMEVCGEAASADEAMTLVGKLKPTAAVVDVSLADAHGLDLVENIRTQYPDTRVVVFSMYDENVYAERALRAGASAYVMKTEPTKVVVEALRTAVRGEVYLSRSASTRLLMRSLSGRSSDRNAGLEELTDREMAVFQMVGEGYTIEDISERLHISRKTAEHYRRRIKQKLELSSIGELVQYSVRWMHGQGNGH